MMNMQPIFKTEAFQTVLVWTNLSQRLDSREHDNDFDLDLGLRLADDAYELPTSHGPTMR